jgi:hypothetical protein
MHLGGVHLLSLDILPLPPTPLAALLQVGGHDFIMESQAHMLPMVARELPHAET